MHAKCILVYSSRFEVATPPNYYLSLAKELGKHVPTIILDAYSTAYGYSKKNTVVAIFASFFALITFSGFSSTHVQSKFLRKILMLRLSLYKLLGYKVVVIKNFPEHHFSDELLNADFTAFDCTDHFYPQEFSDTKNELKKFNCVFVNFVYMKSLLSKYNKKVHITSTGYIRETYKGMKSKSDKSVVFSGGIARRINFELLQKCIELLPDFTFYFIGEVYLDKYYLDDESKDKQLLLQWQKILTLPNVTYLGVKTVKESLKILDQYTVGIVPYDVNDYMNRYSNPMKVYEYLLCGLPVVSVPIFSALENSKKYPVYIANDATDFSEKIKYANQHNTVTSNRKMLLSDNMLKTKVASILQGASHQ